MIFVFLITILLTMALLFRVLKNSGATVSKREGKV